MKSYNKSLDYMINIFYIPLIIIGILGAINELFLGILDVGHLGMLLIDVLVLIGIIGFFSRKKLKTIAWKPIKGAKILKVILIVALILWQGYIVLTCSGISMWDPGILALTATENFKQVWVNTYQYFSNYSNTVPLLLLEHNVWLFLGKPEFKDFIVAMGMLNIVLVDVAILCINIFTKKVVNSKIVKNVSVSASIIFMGITPWICIIYTDVIAFFLSALELLLLALWKGKSVKTRCVISVLGGVIAVADLLIKPSLIIFYIALAIIIIFNLNKISWKHLIAYIVSFGLSFVLIWGTYNNFQAKHQTLVKIDKKMAMPMSHFAAMGIQGNGGYSLDDVNFANSIKNPQKRNQKELQLWKKRFDKMGVLGYERFLIKKQATNLSSGSFAWGHEGIFLIPFKKDAKTQSQLPRQLYVQKDNVAHWYNPNLLVFIQFIWCIGLILMLCAAFEKNVITELMKLTVLGFMLFLLIFESGRSRYLIQFLPFMLVLMGIGFNKVYCKLKRTKN